MDADAVAAAAGGGGARVLIWLVLLVLALLQIWPLAWACSAAWASSSSSADGPLAWCAPPPAAGCVAPTSARTEASGRSACGHDVDPSIKTKTEQF